MGIDSEAPHETTGLPLAADADFSLGLTRAKATTASNTTDAADAVQRIRDVRKHLPPQFQSMVDYQTSTHPTSGGQPSVLP
jgi:hypothetical protein